MKRLFSILAVGLLLVVGVVSLLPGHGSAAAASLCDPADNPLTCACSAGGGAASSAACSAKTSDPIAGPNGILKKVSLVLATLGGVAAVIIIIVGGFQYVTAAGDANKAAGARRAVIGAAVGLTIIAVAESLVILVVSKL